MSRYYLNLYYFKIVIYLISYNVKKKIKKAIEIRGVIFTP